MPRRSSSPRTPTTLPSTFFVHLLPGYGSGQSTGFTTPLIGDANPVKVYDVRSGRDMTADCWVDANGRVATAAPGTG